MKKAASQELLQVVYNMIKRNDSSASDEKIQFIHANNVKKIVSWLCAFSIAFCSINFKVEAGEIQLTTIRLLFVR